MGTIKALCISEKKGTLKTPIHKALFQTEWGMVGDAHAGRWHRQVSFLGLAEIEEFRKRGIDVKLTHAYQEMLADGTMERLVSKYFDDPSPFLNVEGLS